MTDEIEQLVASLRDDSDDPYFMLTGGVGEWLEKNWKLRETSADMLMSLRDRLHYANGTADANIARANEAEARAEEAGKRVKELEAEFHAMTVEMRAVNIARVIEGSGVDFVDLANRCGTAEKALKRIAAPRECGCRPCVGQCRSAEALEIENEGLRDIARTALGAKPTIL